MFWICIGLNADPDIALYLNADPDPDPGSQTNADPRGSGSGSWSDFEVKQVNFYIYLMYHRGRILETSTLSCNEEEEEITKPPTR